ncbi:hypothetical protein [Caldimonas sp. KR1-144]|uniref:hypothetical protein n=1 Tax=Caldimonas sp. KR1-144 TaxID=3400911 RepID=UPI003BFC6AD6
MTLTAEALATSPNPIVAQLAATILDGNTNDADNADSNSGDERFASLDGTAEMAATTAEEDDENPPPLLLKILSTKRCHGSASERSFVEDFLFEFLDNSEYVDDVYYTTAPKADKEAKNLVAIVKYPDGRESKTLFSCHTDTCHTLLGSDESQGLQNLAYDPNMEQIFLGEEARKEGGNVLGADDGVGIWLMLEMVKRGVPGTYVFHRGEERSCIGSKHLSQAYDAWLRSFDRAIAFDRPGCDEVITHQRSERGCSKEFAEALAGELTMLGNLTYEPSDRGVFTDTACYFRQIPECTNLGVGYDFQHGPDEYLDWGHARELADVIVRLDWDALPTKRDPAAKPEHKSTGTYGRGNWGGNSHGYGGYGAYGTALSTGGVEDDEPLPTHSNNVSPFPTSSSQAANTGAFKATTVAGLAGMSRREIAVLVREKPLTVERLLVDLLSERKGLEARLEQLRLFL